MSLSCTLGTGDEDMTRDNWPFPFSTSTCDKVDLSSQDAFNQGAPFATFDRMRREDPIAWCPEDAGRGFWSITRHSDIMELNRNTRILSSARGIRMEDQSQEEYEARKTFQETDPPDHTQFRMLVNPAFTKRSVAAYEEKIRGITEELIDRTLDAGEIDATKDIARKLPMRMLASIMGVPESDTEWLVERGDALISNADPDYTDHVIDHADTSEFRLMPFRSPAAIELFEYANEILARIRRGEEVGVFNMVLGTTRSGESMSDDDFRNFFCLLVAAGNDTTRFSLAACIHALANLPNMLDLLRQADTAGLTTAADEMIRWASPTTHFRRTATEDFDCAGKTIRAGDKVVLWFISANRDEQMFETPYEIKLDRRPNRFLSFGQGGPHVCLGMFLAKLEVRVVLEILARRVARIEQTAAHAFLRSNFILGIKRLPVIMHSR